MAYNLYMVFKDHMAPILTDPKYRLSSSSRYHRIGSILALHILHPGLSNKNYGIALRHSQWVRLIGNGNLKRHCRVVVAARDLNKLPRLGRLARHGT